MMRLAWIILALGAMYAGLTHLRASQTASEAEMYRLEARRIEVRRKLWDQQVRLGELSAPQPALWRARCWPLEIVGPDGLISPDGAVAHHER